MKLKKNNKSKENKLKNERRTFLKRAVYTAPTLMVLGSLVKPETAAAACGTSGPPGTPGGCNE